MNTSQITTQVHPLIGQICVAPISVTKDSIFGSFSERLLDCEIVDVQVVYPGRSFEQLVLTVYSELTDSYETMNINCLHLSPQATALLKAA